MAESGHRSQLLQLITRYNLHERHPDLARVKTLIERGLFPDDLARDYLLRIDQLVQDAIDHPNHLHRPPEADELYPQRHPDIELGSLIDNPDIRFGLRIKDRPRSVLVTGNSGSGKTTAIRNIVTKIDRLRHGESPQHISLIIPDKKLDYTHLADEPGSDWVRLSVHDAGTRLGLNVPDGVSPDAWINLIASVFCARAGLIAAWTCFANMLRWLLRVLNPHTGDVLRWPSLRLMLDVVSTAPLSLFAAKPDYEKSLIGALEAATQATDVFDCFGGLDIERDIVEPKKHLVLEMPNVAPAWLRQFMLDLIFAQILYGRIHRHQKIDGTDVVICLDEADQDATADADNRFPDRMSPLALMLRQGREYGIATIVGLGRMNHASPYVLTEPQYHLVFNQSDAASILTARHTLVLPPEADLMFPALQPGECIAREAQGPWPHPMLVKIDHLPPGRGSAMRAYGTHPIIPPQRLDDLPEVQKALKDLVAAKRARNLDQPRKSTGTLGKNAHALLHAAVAHRWFPVARLWETAGRRPSPEAQGTARMELERRGFAVFSEMRAGRANVLLISVTDKGYEFLGSDAPKGQGRGGIAHQHVAAWIAEVGRRRGHQTHIEWIAPGTNHPVDVVWQHGSSCEVFECVITAETNLVSHIQACFVDSSAVTSLSLVFLQKRIRDRIQLTLAGAPAVQPYTDRIHFEVVETFMKALWP